MVRPIGEQALAAEEGGLKNLKTAITTLLQVGMKIRKKIRKGGYIQNLSSFDPFLGPGHT
jgi:hypothetical protein